MDIKLVSTASNSYNFGIYANNVSNVSVKNGGIVGFTFGVEMAYPQGASNVNFGHLVDGLHLTNNEVGVGCYMSKACVVRNCQFEGDSMVSNSLMEQEIALVTT